MKIKTINFGTYLTLIVLRGGGNLLKSARVPRYNTAALIKQTPPV